MESDIRSQSGFYLESIENITNHDIDLAAKQVLNGSLQSITLPLTDDQIFRLESVDQQYFGIKCLLNGWFINEPKLPEDTFCETVWDNSYCWPPTPLNTTVTRTCREVFQDARPDYADHAEGTAWRVCQENGTWLWGNWTNYLECADSFDEFIRITNLQKEENDLKITSQYTVYIGSILSLICLSIAVFIFSYFKCLRCDRVTLLNHLMISLILRYILLFVITDPYIFTGFLNYKNVDFICKSVLTIYLYATVASVNWMFIQGIYIHGKLTTNIFQGETSFKTYYAIGWVFPLVLLGIYVVIMEWRHPVNCWKGYSDMNEMFIVIVPMLLALFINFLFLINILRILLTTVQNRTGTVSSDAMQIKRAAKATAFLVPLLGVSNLFFVYNPGGAFRKYYVIGNSALGSSQGIFVAIGYCFLGKDVKDVLCRAYRRFNARRNLNRVPVTRQNASVFSSLSRLPLRFGTNVEVHDIPTDCQYSSAPELLALSGNAQQESHLLSRVSSNSQGSNRSKSSIQPISRNVFGNGRKGLRRHTILPMESNFGEFFLNKVTEVDVDVESEEQEICDTNIDFSKQQVIFCKRRNSM